MSQCLTVDFERLMNQLATAWSEQDVEMALACFTVDAVYMEPPDVQLYEGHTQLQPYFAALEVGTYMDFHHLCFDETKQIGVGEFSFGMHGKALADHGVIVVELRDGKITFWREYHCKGPAAFTDFLKREDKAWQWHIGNYP